MPTLDAQSLLAHLVASDRDVRLPDRWRHGRDGSLAWRFSGGTDDFTWDAVAVEDMAARWRALGLPRPAAVAPFAEVHERLLHTLSEADRPLPDAVIHDLGTREVSAVWQDERLVVIADAVGEPPVRAASRG